MQDVDISTPLCPARRVVYAPISDCAGLACSRRACPLPGHCTVSGGKLKRGVVRVFEANKFWTQVNADFHDNYPWFLIFSAPFAFICVQKKFRKPADRFASNTLPYLN